LFVFSSFFPADDAWALVTGATAGLGEGFAFELANRGFNLILVSRSEEKLRATSAAIRAKYPTIQVKVVRSEAASVDEQETNLSAIVDVASSVPLRILVNNVGVAIDDFIADTSIADIDTTLHVNCRYGTLLTRALIPVLRRTSAGAIVNVASRSGIFHFPYWGVYSGTKAYVIALSHALREELMADGIEVLAHIPSRFVSAMSGFDTPEAGVCSAEESVRGALNAIGLRDHAGYSRHQWYLKLHALWPADWRGRWFMDEARVWAAAREVERAKAAAGKKE
jgi:17beta-estradiol 17-dehydrogenase / very-long-chain 3-oxoacyl-CoA reductase